MKKKKRSYMYLVEVKCKAPQGYKPRTMTYKGLIFGKTQRDHTKIEEMAVAEIKTRLEEKNKGLSIAVTAKVTLYLDDFVLSIDEI